MPSPDADPRVIYHEQALKESLPTWKNYHQRILIALMLADSYKDFCTIFDNEIQLREPAYPLLIYVITFYKKLSLELDYVRTQNINDPEIAQNIARGRYGDYMDLDGLSAMLKEEGITVQDQAEIQKYLSLFYTQLFLALKSYFFPSETHETGSS